MHRTITVYFYHHRNPNFETLLYSLYDMQPFEVLSSLKWAQVPSDGHAHTSKFGIRSEGFTVMHTCTEKKRNLTIRLQSFDGWNLCAQVAQSKKAKA